MTPTLKRPASFALSVGLTLALLTGTGCTAGQERVLEAPTPAPAPEGLDVPSQGQVYRFIDPTDESVKTALDIDAIPEQARQSVLVFDPKAPTPAGWEHVVDVSKALPTRSVPQQGFVLRPAIAPISASSVTPKQKGHEVVMFSTQGCGFCTKARTYFKKNKVAFSEFDVERDANAGPKLKEMANAAKVPLAQLQGGVPLIFINGEPHVGFDKRKIGRLLGI